MTSLLAPLLAFLQASGYLTLWLIAFVAAAGGPLPIAPLLIAAGAFATQGTFNLAVLFAVTLTATLAGDSVAYWAGRRWGSHLLDRLPRTRVVGRVITAKRLARSRQVFERDGGWAIVLTRTVLSSLGSVTNVVAGMECYSFRAFLLWNILGNSIGILAKLLIGYIVGANWRAAVDLVGNLSLYALIACGLIAVVFVAYSVMLARLRRRRDTTDAPLRGARGTLPPQ